MNIRESIFDLLKTDYPLRKKISDELDIREGTVLKWGYRKQHAKVGNYLVVNIIKSHCGINDDEIFEPETKTENVA